MLSARFAGTATTCNAYMTPAQIQQFCALDTAGDKLMKAAFERMGLTARSHDRVLRLARTIADLDAVKRDIYREDGIIGGRLKKQHLMEAVQMRALDKKYWQV